MINFPKNDKFSKIRPFITKLNLNFQKQAQFSENHSVDETMTSYFENCGWRHFIKGKIVIMLMP